jgi:hypothetical protein
MSGWVEDEFAMGLRVPLGAETYTLYWPGNSPIDLVAEEQTVKRILPEVHKKR